MWYWNFNRWFHQIIEVNHDLLFVFDDISKNWCLVCRLQIGHKTQPINNQYFPQSLSRVQVLTSLWNQSYVFTVGNALWKRGTLESLIAESNSYLHQYHKVLLNMLQLYILLTEWCKLKTCLVKQCDSDQIKNKLNVIVNIIQSFA